MQKWEYIYAVITKGDSVFLINERRQNKEQSLIELLREKGNEGWELVSVMKDDYGSRTFFFKRPK